MRGRGWHRGWHRGGGASAGAGPGRPWGRSQRRPRLPGAERHADRALAAPGPSSLVPGCPRRCLRTGWTRPGRSDRLGRLDPFGRPDRLGRRRLRAVFRRGGSGGGGRRDRRHRGQPRGSRPGRGAVERDGRAEGTGGSAGPAGCGAAGEAVSAALQGRGLWGSCGRGPVREGALQGALGSSL